MIKRRRSIALHHSVPLIIFELLLVLCVLGLGAWQIHTSWKNPVHVGWTTSGAILITGMFACAGLLWHRWRTRHNAFVPILFTIQLANSVEGILKWRAHENGASWPVMHCALAISFLALIIWDETNLRKEAVRDAARESKYFDMEDTL